MTKPIQLSRRQWLHGTALGALSLAVSPLLAQGAKQKAFAEPARIPYSGSDDALLDEIERTAFDFFWSEAGMGMTRARSRALQRPDLACPPFASRMREATGTKRKLSSEYARPCVSCGGNFPTSTASIITSST